MKVKFYKECKHDVKIGFSIEKKKIVTISICSEMTRGHSESFAIEKLAGKETLTATC